MPGVDAAESMLEGVDSLALLDYEAPPIRSGQSALAFERHVNVDGAGRVAAVAARLGVPLVFASSADIYGPWHAEPVNERTAPRGSSPYGVGKLEAEQLIARTCNRGAGSVSVRLATVYGPDEHRTRAIPAFIRALTSGERPVIHGDGSDRRDYVHVSDVARGLARLLIDAEAFTAAAPVVNIGSGIGRTTLDVLAAVEAAFGRAAEPIHVPSERPPSRLVLDIAHARRTLRFTPRTAFADGIAEEAGMAQAVAS